MEIQFYRQKPLGNFITYFYAPAVNLVIEVDGCQHSETEHLLRDERSDEFLAERGLCVLRFDNWQVLRQTDAVVARILDFVHEKLNPP